MAKVSQGRAPSETYRGDSCLLQILVVTVSPSLGFFGLWLHHFSLCFVIMWGSPHMSVSTSPAASKGIHHIGLGPTPVTSS